MHSVERNEGQKSYRAWSAQTPNLPLFRQPAWLDLVSRTWTASADDWDAPSYVWPYDTRTKLGLTYLSPPPATPRLGPQSLHANAVFPLLPSTCGYGWYTLDDPRDLWRVNSRARAMATLKLDLTQPIRYSKSLRRRLRHGRRSLTVAPLEFSTLSRVATLVGASHAFVPPEAHAALTRAREMGIGQILVATNMRGEVEAVAGVAIGASESYGLYTVRSPTAGPNTGATLQAAIVDLVRQRGVRTHDFLAGNLPGPREFFLAFGAKPVWYAQVRASRSKAWTALEWLRAHTNKQRI